VRYLEENAAALSVRLSPAELAAIDAASPRNVAAGARYPAAGMARVNV
jgi:aryl-alcohol dehydrogenase-like predicted oxidoreductase